MLLGEDSGLNGSVNAVGMRFAPSQCEIMLYDWIG